jgi:hypothetical protein
MADGGTTEIIWHFAGYLRLFEAEPASRANHDSFDHAAPSPDYTVDLTPDALPKADLPEIASKPLKFTLPVTPPPTAFTTSPEALPAPMVKALQTAPQFEESVPHASAQAGTTISGGHDTPPYGEPATLPYSVNYEDGGNDKIVSVVQANLLDDDDALVANAGAGLSEMHTTDVPEVLAGLLAKAGAATPDDLTPQGHSPLHWQEFVEERDAALKEEGGGTTVEEGIYVNGELISGKPAAAPARPELPEKGEAGTQVLETGGNKAVNTAVIADLNEATGTLIVLGDYYETNAIIQANVSSDNDQVLPGSENASQAITGDNLALNIATLVAEEVAGKRGDGISAKGLDVDVTIAEGDLFDVKSLVQRNWISDNDEAIQTTSDAFSATYVGGNTQGNAARFVDLAHYDVIIVLGDYHDFNMISQTNVVLDDDILGSPAGGPGSAGGAQHGGRNHLVNDASIENHGSRGFKDVTDDLEDLIDTIGGRGLPSLDDWSGFAGSASGRLDVLVVRGDYWDINVISQTNVITDADVGLQHLSEGGGSQWMNTGGNDAHNIAKIVDMGGIFDQYLGGEHYTDAVMIQAEYIDASSTVVNNDTMALVSEAVAYTGLLDQPMTDDPLETALGRVGHDDMMGAVLT